MPYNSVADWDSVPAEPGNQPLYVEAPDGQVRAGSPYSCTGGGCDGKRTCVGGKNAGRDCTKEGVRVCQGGVCVGVDAVVGNTEVGDGTAPGAIKSIQEIFAKSMGIWRFEQGGYVKNPSIEWDVTDVLGDTQPPTVANIFVEPTQGSKSLPVTLNFYAWADDNHMPLKKITIDWGDGQKIVSGGEESYYQNHKAKCTERCDGGVNDGKVCSKIAPCADPGICRLQFGDSREACVAGSFEFSHVYSCAGPGDCIFQPKVQVLDNWGWCNGKCASGGGKGCYDGSSRDELNECDINNKDYFHWTEFSGNIIVAP